jgi:integrase
LLGLYTGARLEEICQLLRTDVIQQDGIWCLNIDESDAPEIKSVKTSEQRIIPLHPFLVDDLRFIDYVHGLKKKTSEYSRSLNR